MVAHQSRCVGAGRRPQKLSRGNGILKQAQIAADLFRRRQGGGQNEADGRGAAQGSLHYPQCKDQINVFEKAHQKDDKGTAQHRPLKKKLGIHPCRQAPPERGSQGCGDAGAAHDHAYPEQRGPVAKWADFQDIKGHDDQNKIMRKSAAELGNGNRQETFVG